jgi:hypothetical protein
LGRGDGQHSQAEIDDAGQSLYIALSPSQKIDAFLYPVLDRFTVFCLPLFAVLLSSPLYAQTNGLLDAIKQHNLPAIEQALLAGENPRQPDDYGIPLINRAAAKNQPDILQKLLLAGADVNQADRHGWSPLLVAVTYGYLDSVKLLLDFYADPVQADKDGLTPMRQAVIKGNKEILYRLIRASELKQTRHKAASTTSIDTLLRQAVVENEPDAGYRRLPPAQDFAHREDLVRAYQNLFTAQKQLYLLELLSSIRFKQTLSLDDYLNWLLSAKQTLPEPEAYGYYHFSLYTILDNKYRFSNVEKDLMRQLLRVNHLIAHPLQARALLINNNPLAVGHIQPDISIDSLLRIYPHKQDDWLFRLYAKRLQELGEILDPAITNYSFTGLISALANPDTSSPLRKKLQSVFQRRLSANALEHYDILLYDWKNSSSVYLGLKLKARQGETILSAIRNTPLQDIYQSIQAISNPNQHKVVDVVLQYYGLNRSDIEQLSIDKIEINGQRL